MKNLQLQIFILIVILTSCQSKKDNTVPNEASQSVSNPNEITLTDAQYKNAAIELGSFENQNTNTILKVNGKVDVPPQNLVMINPPTSGYLRRSLLLPGTPVGKGKVIAYIDDPSLIGMQEEYLQAKNKLTFLEKEYQRQKELNQYQASSDKVLQKSLADLNEQKIKIQSLDSRFRYLGINPSQVRSGRTIHEIPIYSPISGYVASVNSSEGSYVTPSTAMFELIDPSDIHLSLQVFEKDIPNLFVGQKLQAYTNSDPIKKHPCEIILISKDVSVNGLIEVHCHFLDYDPKLLTGTFMSADIATHVQSGNVLPEASIVNFEGSDFVFIPKGKKSFEMVPVTVGQTTNGFSQILNYEDIKTKNIVTKGAYTLLMALKNTEEE